MTSAGTQDISPTAPATTSFQQKEITTAQAGGNSEPDSNGVSFSVPSGALNSDVTAQLTALVAVGELPQALQENYTLDSPFYSVSTQNQDSGTGLATLTFPALNAKSQILAVIDDRYPILLNIKPQDGKLTVRTHLGAGDVDGLPPIGTSDPGGSIYYAVITPKGDLGSISADLVIPVDSQWQQTNTNTNCSPEIIKSRDAGFACRANSSGSVVVSYNASLGMTGNDVDNVVNKIEVMMKTYADLGFTSARSWPDAPMIVVVADRSGDPIYKNLSGVIYLPVDIARDIERSGNALWHEMGHWVQNKSYNMTLAYWSDAKKWWIEVSAENMVMLAAPDYIKNNMDTYGTITAEDNSQALTNSPYQWTTDLYVHAQLVKLNMCESGCPLSQKSFVEAINNGIYPYSDESKQAALTANLDEYARYLLGVSPLKANTSISLLAVASQANYGQGVSISFSNTKGSFYILQDGNAPQVTVQKKNGWNNLVFSVPIQKDGVYPLEILSGIKGQSAGLPAMLTISPGAPFYYRLDNGDVEYNDGSKQIVLGPIHLTMGISDLRLVALSKTGEQSFNGRLEVIDLKGAWAIEPGEMVSKNIVCSGDAETLAFSQDLAKSFAMLSGIFTLFGDMTPNATDGSSLDWTSVAGRQSSGIDSAGFSMKGTALITENGVKLQTGLEMSPPTSSSSTKMPPLVAVPGLAMLALLPAGKIRQIRDGKKRKLAIIMIIGFVGLLLVGCVGLSITGTINSDMTITGLQYVGGTEKVTIAFGQPMTGDPIWRITDGTATYQINLTIIPKSLDGQGYDTSKTAICSGPATFKITGGIYPDVTVLLPAD